MSDNDLHFIASTLRDAETALKVLFTMCTKAGLKEGAMVADEILGNVRTAIKHCMLLTSDITQQDAAAMLAVMEALEAEKASRCGPRSDSRCPNMMHKRYAMLDCKECSPSDFPTKGSER